ncbi:MAG TPA: type II toxin-antitoxin system PemK/MazF family toxin [Cellulomonas sp.]
MANGWLDALRSGLRSALRATRPSSSSRSSGSSGASRASRTAGPQRPTTWPRRTATARPTNLPQPGRHVALPDYEGRLTPVYAPHLDGEPDPGEVVWTWVPFEDDPSQGKDRPVLVIGTVGTVGTDGTDGTDGMDGTVGTVGHHLLGLMLTSKDHDRHPEREAQRGRHWMDVGSGAWDAQHRPSEVRLDRVLTIDPLRVRREGSIMPKPLFDEIVRSLSKVKGW